MQGRYSPGIILALLNDQGAKTKDALVQWHDSVFRALPKMAASVSYSLFYEADRTKAPGEEAAYLVLYETRAGTIREALQLLHHALGKTGRPEGAQASVRVLKLGAYERIGPEFTSASSALPAKGLLLASTNCTEPAREAEFNRWYDGPNMDDILGTGLFHTAYRFRDVNTPPVFGRYLAAYETERADPANVREEMQQRYGALWRAAGHPPDFLQVVWRGAFRLLVSSGGGVPQK